jgi:hypothetical protein
MSFWADGKENRLFFFLFVFQNIIMTPQFKGGKDEKIS